MSILKNSLTLDQPLSMRNNGIFYSLCSSEGFSSRMTNVVEFGLLSLSCMVFGTITGNFLFLVVGFLVVDLPPFVFVFLPRDD